MPKDKKTIKIEEEKEKKKSKLKKTTKATKKPARIKKIEEEETVEKLAVRKKIDSLGDTKTLRRKKKATDQIDLSDEKEQFEDSIKLGDTRADSPALDLRESEEADDEVVDLSGEKTVSDEKDLGGGGAVASMISSLKAEKAERKGTIVLSDSSTKSYQNDGQVDYFEDVDDEDEDEDSSVNSGRWGDNNDPSQIKISPEKMADDEELIDDNSASSEEGKKYGRSIGIYRKMAYFFIFLFVVLASAVFYLTSIKVIITLIPSQERISSSMMFDVFGKPMSDLSENAMSGSVEEITIEHSSIFESSGEEIIGKDATGKARLINNYNRNQPLVATTRLLSPDGELFRIRETVTIPAGGEVEVEIYADDPRADIYVGPTKFTIPGLWAGLQDQIYAETDKEITYKQQVNKYVTEADISSSIKNIRLQFEDIVKQKIFQDYREDGQVVYEIDKGSIRTEADAGVGDEVDEFKVDMRAKVVVVTFDTIKAAKFAQQKFVASLPKQKELINFDSEAIEYVVDDYDSSDQLATVKAVFEGRVSLKGWSSVINKNEIVGLNREQIEAYATSKDEISSIEVKFYPPFIKKVPKYIESGRIQVEIRK